MSTADQPQASGPLRTAEGTEPSYGNTDRYRLQLEAKIAAAKRANDTVLVGMLKEQLADADGVIEDPDSPRQSS